MTLGCLGAGEYAARIVTRPLVGYPARPIGAVNVSSGSWGRTLNAVSTAGLVVPLTGTDCAQVLSQAIPWLCEVEVWRKGLLVWCGPITDVSADPGAGTATIAAQDLAAWWEYRVLTEDMVATDLDSALVFASYVEAGMAPDNPGMEIEVTPTGVPMTRTVAGADLRTVAQEVAEITGAGVDWTVTNRRFWIGAQEVGGARARLPIRFTDESFATPPATRRSGSGSATEVFSRGDGVTGHAGGPDDLGMLLQRVVDDNGTSNQAAVDASAASSLARRTNPQQYLEGQNVLASSVPLDVQTLIPGVLAPVAVSGGGVVEVIADLRLESVGVEFDAEGDRFTVSLQPEGTVLDG